MERSQLTFLLYAESLENLNEQPQEQNKDVEIVSAFGVLGIVGCGFINLNVSPSAKFNERKRCGKI